MTLPKYTAHCVLLLLLVAVGWFGLSTLLLSVLFAYFALDQLRILKKKWLTLLVFFVLLAIACGGVVYMVHQAYTKLPPIAKTAIPTLVNYAQEHNVDLPFTDWETLKSFATDSAKEKVHFVSDFAKLALKELIFIIIGVVVAISLFLTPSPDLNAAGTYRVKNNLYTVFWRDFAIQFHAFYQSFKIVMKAQLIISTINTGLTAVFLTITSMHYTAMLVVLTFICGLLPIIGNLISNSVIVAVGFTITPMMGVWALIFLIVLHKLEYFLNSKIIGDQIKNPVWLTLLGLLVGERLLGIAGMILAPVVLYYLKREATQMFVANAESENKSRNPNAAQVGDSNPSQDDNSSDSAS